MKTKLCKPILIESKEPNKLRLDNNGKLTFKPHVQGLHYSGLVHTYQQLILINLDPNEKIEVEDLVYHKRLSIITHYFTNAKAYLNAGEYQKVIVTQDQLSPEYIQQFIEEYNKNEVKNVEIEMESWTVYSGDHQNTPRIYSPKLINGFVIIIKKKPILYTEEEVYELTKEAVGLWRKNLHNIELYRNKEHHSKWWDKIKKK